MVGIAPSSAGRVITAVIAFISLPDFRKDSKKVGLERIV